MDSAKTIEIGQAIDNMTQMDGWKYLAQWIKERENECISNLKKAENWDDVIKLQAELRIIDRINGKVKEWIINKNKILRKESEQNGISI